jgi:hypothetical protein
MAICGMCGIIVIWILIGLTVGLDTGLWPIRVLTFSSGFASGWCVIAVQSASFATISSADTGRASALFNTQNQVAGGVGVAVLVTVISALTPAGATGAALIPVFHRAFFTAAALAALGAPFALTIRDADAAGTMRRRERVPETSPPATAVPPGLGEGTADLG